MGQQWQYLTQVFEERLIQDELDELGEAGWELISAQWEEYSYGGRQTHQARCILKRLRPEGADDDFRPNWQRATAGLS